MIYFILCINYHNIPAITEAYFHIYTVEETDYNLDQVLAYIKQFYLFNIFHQHVNYRNCIHNAPTQFGLVC